MSPFQEAPVTSSDKTFIALRADVVEGVIKAGAKLSEAELSTNYGVSRAVVREAINRLENASLVERKANVGAVMAPPYIRPFVEVAGAARSVARRPPEKGAIHCLPS